MSKKLISLMKKSLVVNFYDYISGKFVKIIFYINKFFGSFWYHYKSRLFFSMLELNEAVNYNNPGFHLKTQAV
jgi:hypothetical protein